jgi:8-oxo-dGTP pyrophosphatase MutT (NUDIX family)
VAPEPELRVAARAIVLDPADRILLVLFRDPHTGKEWWATPGGALDPGETHEDGLRRELLEETGVRADIGACAWVREHVFDWGERRIRQVERYYVVRVSSAEIAPHLSAEELAHESVHELRWWSLDALEVSADDIAPRRLAELVRELLANGPPPEPIDAGI